MSQPNETNEENQSIEGEGEGEGDITLKILVQSNLVGLIIGKGGSAIKDVSASNLVQIKLSNEQVLLYERILTIKGKKENVISAQRSIYTRIQTDQVSEIWKETEKNTKIEDVMCLSPLKILVPVHFVGRLIGKGGLNLKEIMLKTNTYIQCLKEDNLMDERIVSVVGSINSQVNAEEIILDQLLQHQLQHEQHQQQHHQQQQQFLMGTNVSPFQPFLPPRIYPLPPPSHIYHYNSHANHNQNYQNQNNHNNNNNTTNNTTNNNNGNNSNNNNNVTNNSSNQSIVQSSSTTNVSSPQEQQQQPQQQQQQKRVYRPLNNTTTTTTTPHYQEPVMRPVSNFSNPYGSPFHNMRDRPNQVNQQVDKICVYVPNVVIGSIIGKGGSTVKEMSRYTKTGISIARNDEVDPNDSFRPTYIEGTIENLFKAQRMLYKKIVEGGFDHTIKVDILVPEEMVGRIIGKKGNQIQNISKTTGCRLVLGETNENERESGSKVITIIGKNENNIAAQQLIRDILYYHSTKQEEEEE